MFWGFLEEGHVSSQGTPREAAIGVPLLAHACLGHVQELFCPSSLVTWRPRSLGGVSLLGPPEPWSTEGAVFSLAKKRLCG